MIEVTCGTITVVPAFDPAAVSFVNCESSDEVEVGETATVSGTFINDNDVEASVTHTLIVSGDEAGTDTVSVPGGGETDVEWEFEAVEDDLPEIEPSVEFEAAEA